MTPPKTETEKVTHGDGSTTIQAADPNPPSPGPGSTNAAKRDAIVEIERALNEALIVWGHDDEDVRRALLSARGGIREALGEART